MNKALKTLVQTQTKSLNTSSPIFFFSQSKLVAIDYQHPEAAKLFTESLKETGFGVLKNHPITKEQVSSIYSSWQKFFDNQERKDQFLYNKGTQDGYFPPSISETAKGASVKDIKEYFHVYPWGQIPEELKEETMAYYNHANQFSSELLGWIEANTESNISNKFNEPLSSMINKSDQTLLRILHYPPMTGNEEPGAIRAAAHEDINLITVLPAANEPGLQVKLKTGEWVDVPSDFGNIIINIGDMLQEASGGYFPSTSHRVINPSGEKTTKSRISLPLFLHPRPDVVLSDKYTAESYLHERLVELGVI